MSKVMSLSGRSRPNSAILNRVTGAARFHLEWQN